MTKSATREAADEVSAPIASPVFTGNVGVGVTPEAWDSSHKALQVGAALGLSSDTTINRSHISSAAYQDGTSHTSGWKYMDSSSGATDIHTYNGGIDFRVAPSGSADAAISWNTAMTIDNAGRVTKPLQPAFSVSVNSYSGINCAPQSHLIRFGEQSSGAGLFNNGNYFDTTNRRFVAPVSGFYQFNVHIRMDGTSGDYVYLTMVRNGSTNLGRDLDVGVGSYVNRSISVVASLSANDYVDCNARTSGDTSIGIDGDSWFSGHLIG